MAHLNRGDFGSSHRRNAREDRSRMNDTISCTGCGSILRRVAAMTPGTAIQCPRCHVVFTAPELDGAAVAGITTQPTDAPPPRVATLDDQGVTARPLAPLTRPND